jgi:hypothetical protein
LQKREADFTLTFRHWLKANRDSFGCAAFELKQTRSCSLPFSDVQEHQIDALLAAKSGQGILYKAPDDSRGIKPFDLFYLKASDAFIVIKYPGYFFIIDVHRFIEERDSSDRKSLTSLRAMQIANTSVNLKNP